MIYAFTIDPTSFPAAKVSKIGDIVNLALPLMMTGAGLIFLFVTLNAAFSILRNGDNPDALKKAYAAITTAVIGLIIVVASYLVIQLLGIVLPK
ncbi:hypothetical protein CO165_05195 [Candidatus Roizmanbacteria bacterium CG_4_9_14_3_um_filter_33_18]|uniref:Uncharacterized protein n=2 Tax=Candidatus Roizmaniibacteriota TaxID=1752723 RepID=A0A2M7U9B2_9BACT|nr:MAG: hypothetical protein COY12_01195 [Candidatus Roizmanbacteria bacterium CG_4_10_14_0_2_um_filter_33_96]PJA55135.1 MAG: hypothetical protein CO165_05195 [Candidatus Roizmanbacteria bacterium CG_4_9_14_3_um_filter_33_18]